MSNQDMTRDSFILYKSFFGPISGLTDEELGQLFRAIFEWQIDGQPCQDLTGAVGMAFGFITNQFRIDQTKYQERCEMNRANGKLGGRPKKNQSVIEKPGGFEKTHNDNENENENGNVIGGPGDESPAMRKRKSFVKPSLTEVADYCNERATGQVAPVTGKVITDPDELFKD